MSAPAIIVMIMSSCCVFIIIATVLGLFFSHKNGSIKSDLLDNIFGEPETDKKASNSKTGSSDEETTEATTS